MANKVKYNLKNVHAAVLTESVVHNETVFTYGTPRPIPGAVSIALDAQGDPEIARQLWENIRIDDIRLQLMNQMRARHIRQVHIHQYGVRAHEGLHHQYISPLRSPFNMNRRMLITQNMLYTVRQPPIRMRKNYITRQQKPRLPSLVRSANILLLYDFLCKYAQFLPQYSLFLNVSARICTFIV